MKKLRHCHTMCTILRDTGIRKGNDNLNNIVNNDKSQSNVATHAGIFNEQITTDLLLI